MPPENYYVIVDAIEETPGINEEILIVFWNKSHNQWVHDISDATHYGREIFTSCPFEFGEFATINEYTPEGIIVSYYCPCLPGGVKSWKKIRYYEVDLVTKS